MVIAGGGTGGHIVPSLQIARALVDRGHPAESIELYGSRRGQEATTWPTLEFPFTLLPGRGVRRSMRPSAWWANLGAVAGLVWACVRALGSFVRRRPRVVVIVGGYASFPAGVAAVLTRVPLVCMTTDSVPGAVNGLLGRFAAANAVAFAGPTCRGPMSPGPRSGRSSPRCRGTPKAGWPAAPCSACRRTARPWPAPGARWAPVR